MTTFNDNFKKFFKLLWEEYWHKVYEWAKLLFIVNEIFTTAEYFFHAIYYCPMNLIAGILLNRQHKTYRTQCGRLMEGVIALTSAVANRIPATNRELQFL